MKLSTCSLLAFAVAHSASAFAPSAVSSSSSATTALHLFGGGNKGKEGGGGDGGKGPGMMEQMAMLKKAQEVAQKKKKIDEDLAKKTFDGESSNGKVKGVFKYVPVSSPMDPNPEYEATSFAFDDEFFESALPEELSAACKETILNGITSVNMAVAEAFEPLNAEVMGMMGGAGQKQG